MDNLNGAETIKATEYILPHKSYTINELIRYMIVDSDNNATAILLKNIEPKILESIYGDLGVELPTDPTDYISAKTYSLFFRILYRSTYLTRDMSEKAMKLLSESEFNDGLKAGVPAGIKLAHKFGEYEGRDNSGSVTKELHDCGVVYYPKHPYMLCVMTKGSDLGNLKEVIKNISQTVYTEIKNQYK